MRFSMVCLPRLGHATLCTAVFFLTCAGNRLSSSDQLLTAAPENACSQAVPLSVKRKYTMGRSAKCKCPRGYEIVGDAAICTVPNRRFNPSALKDHGCSCQEGATKENSGRDRYMVDGGKHQTWNWMGSLADDFQLRDLTIPGTHDTMAYEFKVGHFGHSSPTNNASGMTLTHEDDVEMQLHRGIRWFDVRIGLTGDALQAVRRGDAVVQTVKKHGKHVLQAQEVVTCHGPFHMECNFECMLQKVDSFLSEDRSKAETVFIMLKPECGEKGPLLTERVLRMLQRSEYVVRGAELSPDTKLGSLRGELVVVNTGTWDTLPGLQEGLQKAGISFLTLAGVLSGTSQDVQNDYGMNDDWVWARRRKVEAIVEFLHKCSQERGDSVNVNYFSASGVAYNVMKTAIYVNTKVLKVLQEGLEEDRGHGFGACMLDGLPVGGPVNDLIGTLIDRNFQEFTVPAWRQARDHALKVVNNIAKMQGK